MEKHFIEVLFSVISAFCELNKASGCALIFCFIKENSPLTAPKTPVAAKLLTIYICVFIMKPS